MAVKEIQSVRARNCGDCSLCCKLLAVEELAKPSHRWCSHFAPGTGCAIHGEHPHECRDFWCLWMLQPNLGEAWRPKRAHFVLYFIGDGDQLIVDVDPAHPNAWRREPYHTAIIGWARAGGPRGMSVVVKIGGRSSKIA